MNNRKDTTRRDDITNVRALAIFLVVLGHSIILYSSAWGYYPTEQKSILLDNLKFLINGIQMPLFFSLSGFCFLWSWNRSSDFISQIIKKAQRLIIPYIMIGICWLFPIRMLVKYPYYNGLTVPHIIFKSILLGEDNGHLWFLPTLFFITAATSCIFQILEKSPLTSFKVPIVFGASIYLYHFGIPSANRYINLAEANAIWFALGLTIHYLEANKWFESYKRRKSISIVLILLFLVNLLKQVVPPIASTALTCMALASIYCVIPQKANLLTEKISKNSMGIYLFHSPLESTVPSIGRGLRRRPGRCSSPASSLRTGSRRHRISTVFQILGRRADSLRMGLYTNFLDTTLHWFTFLLPTGPT